MSRLFGGTACTPRTGAAARERHFVTFLMDRWEYGVEVADVCGIYHGVAIIPTPDEPDIITGEVHLSARRIPVVDLRHLLHLPPRQGAGWLLVIEAGGRTVGMLVDHVSEVVRVPAASVTAPKSRDAMTPAGDALTAVVQYGNRTVYLPDLPQILRECPA